MQAVRVFSNIAGNCITTACEIAVLPNALCYVASKGAIEQISRVLAKDLGCKGITVNTFSPGPVDTPLFRAGKPPHVIDAIASLNPNNRLGLPEDISPLVAFLSSPAAQWINGQNLRVNGVSTTATDHVHHQLNIRALQGYVV